MEYWKFRGNHYIVILLEYYMESQSKEGRPDKHFIKTSDLKHIVDNIKNTESGYIFFDMKYVSKAASPSIFLFKR